MFCNHCGRALEAGQAFCAGCGKPVVGAAPAPAGPALGRVARHLSALAVFWIVISAFRLAGSGGLFVAGHFMRRALWEIPGPAHFMQGLFPALGMFLFLGALIGFVCAWGLLQKRPWARFLALVLGGLALLDPPFGTALGIYTLWVLLPARSELEYGALAR